MKWILVAFSVLLVAATVFSEEELDLAVDCDEEACQLPDCRCSSTSIPGGLNPRDTPQFVMLTFDDGVNVININTYRNVIYNRRNTANNCPVGTTYFINHEYTNYEIVNELYNNGFEIALHSISHQTPQTYWAQATYEDMRQEFGEQRKQMSHFANIPEEEIKGIRIPFLQLSGNASFQVMAEYGLQYDSTWPTVTHVNPGLWPYTLDYASNQDCFIPPCPTASIPGIWVFPMVSWLDMEGVACAMVDSCFFVPDHGDEEAWFRFIVENFERHYLGNRAPFPFYVHEWYIASNDAVRNALVRFLDMINSMNDVFMDECTRYELAPYTHPEEELPKSSKHFARSDNLYVNSHEVIDWVRNPIPVDEYKQKACRSFTPTTCAATNCGPLSSTHNVWSQYWMQICNVCPNTYPWLGNPLGE